MLTSTSLYNKWHDFIEEQISYQKHVQRIRTERPDLIESALERERSYREMLDDLRALDYHQAKEQPKKPVAPKVHREIILDYLEKHDGSAFIEAILLDAERNGHLGRSIKGMILRMIREGELSRCGATVEIAGEYDDDNSA